MADKARKKPFPISIGGTQLGILRPGNEFLLRDLKSVEESYGTDILTLTNFATKSSSAVTKNDEPGHYINSYFLSDGESRERT